MTESEMDGDINVTTSKDENTKRGNWSGKLDFTLSSIGYAVGLGNVWRFPYIAYANGGGSFLIPYTIMLLTAGLPLFFMEMSFGQFASLGPITIWRAVPLFKGIGWCMVVICMWVGIYYNMVIAYTVYYLFASFTSELPWQSCRPEWEKYGCQDRASLTRPKSAELTDSNTAINCDDIIYPNGTRVPNLSADCIPKRTPSEIYWEVEVLNISSGFHDGGHEIQWKLALCLLFTWVVVFLCLCKGIKSSGKVVYFTATFPYVVLFILLIRNTTLEGAILGIEFYVSPKWSKLTDPSVWYSAASQIFYSLGVAFGGLQTMASYNKFHNNIYRDSLVVAIINCATSVFAGFVIFSVIGHMAHVTGLKVSEVVSSGPGLAFIAYPEGIAMMPAATLWSILFFLMLFTLGLDSQFGMMETIITAIVDEFPDVLRQGHRRIYFTLVICILFYLCGLSMCSRAGIYVMTVFDTMSAGFSLLTTALFELIAIAWVYGFINFAEDIEMMIGFKPNPFWAIMWIIVSPFMICCVTVFSVVSFSPMTYKNYVFPRGPQVLGWVMVGAALICIPFWAIHSLVVLHRKGDHYTDTLRRTLTPHHEWGPALNKDRTGKYSPLPELEPGFTANELTDVVTTGYMPSSVEPWMHHEASRRFSTTGSHVRVEDI